VTAYLSTDVTQCYLGTTSNHPLSIITNNTERIAITAAGNIGLWGGSFGSGTLVLFIANATTVPTTNPTGGGILYAEAGALKWRGSAGTVTQLAAA
jgi:hypothetical protein